MAENVCEARYETWAALHRDCQQQIAMGGFLLRTSDAGLEQFSAIMVRIVAPSSGGVFELAGQVLQIIPGQGVAMQFGPDANGVIKKLKAACEQNPPTGTPGADEPTIIVAKPSDEKQRRPARLQLPTEPVELRKALEEMTVNQKRQAALSGRREVRLILIKDRNKAVHPFVLKNPGVSSEEIEAFSKMPSVNPDALRMIAKNRDWTRMPSVCRNLVRNPKTPMREALMLLERLPLGDIRAIAKSGNVRMPIQQAARKKINQ